MSTLVVGTKVLLRDRPMGQPNTVGGEIVGILPKDKYRVLIKDGINEGKVISYKYWDLFSD